MFKTGTKIMIANCGDAGKTAIIKGTTRLPKYPRGWSTGYIVQMGRERMSLYPRMVKKIGK